jgi:hypothetical protein
MQDQPPKIKQVVVMHGASRIEVVVPRFGGHDDAPSLCLGNIITEGFGDGVRRQGSFHQASDEIQAGGHLAIQRHGALE